MTDNNPKSARSAADLRVAYMRRAHDRRNSRVPGRYYRLRITPDMVGMSLASAINLLNKRERHKKPRYIPHHKPSQKETDCP